MIKDHLWGLQVLVYSVEGKMRPTLAFLVTAAHVPPERIGDVIAKKPQLLGYSVASKLGPTLAFLRDEVRGISRGGREGGRT